MAGIDFVNALTREAVAQFSAVAQVETVYRSVYQAGVYFTVFTSNQVYDQVLMRRLIAVEIALSGKYPETEQSYRYTAACLVDDPEYVTGPDALCLWAREVCYSNG